MHAGGVEHEWRLLAAKARTWLEEVEATPPSGWMWTHAAKEFLG